MTGFPTFLVTFLCVFGVVLVVLVSVLAGERGRWYAHFRARRPTPVLAGVEESAVAREPGRAALRGLNDMSREMPATRGRDAGLRRVVSVERNTQGQILSTTTMSYREHSGGMWLVDAMTVETTEIREPVRERVPPAVEDPMEKKPPGKDVVPPAIVEPALPPTLERRIRLG